MKKSIIWIAILQFIILAFFLVFWNDTQTVDLSQTKQLDITVREIDYRRDFHESNLYIYDGLKEYKFSKGALSSEYRGVFDVSKELNVGDTLTITYIEDNDVFGEYNLIIDAYSSDNRYLSYQRFNVDKQHARIGVSILFGVVELIFILVSAFIIILSKKTSPSRKRKTDKYRI